MPGWLRFGSFGRRTSTLSNATSTESINPHQREGSRGDVRGELEAPGRGTRLTLWASIPRAYVSMGAAGWHICLDVLDHLLGGAPIGHMVGVETMKFDGWQRLNKEYAKQFGVEAPSW